MSSPSNYPPGVSGFEFQVNPPERLPKEPSKRLKPCSHAISIPYCSHRTTSGLCRVRWCDKA